MEDKNLGIILQTLLDKKAEDVVYIDVSDVNPLACYFIIATANSSRHAMALGQTIKEECFKNNITIRNIEGKNSSDWVLVDANDYVIHIFSGDARVHYGLEKLWANLRIVKVS